MKLTEKIHLLKIDFEINISPEVKLKRFVNVIIIFGSEITIIDTGVKGSEEKIFTYIKENKRNISEINNIILSHSHPDHIGSAYAIKEITNCRILAHQDESDWIENIDIQYNSRPVPGFYNLVDKSIKVDDFLNDGDIIKIDNELNLKIFHSPGHSKGSLNILFIEDNILFTADSIPLVNDIPNYDNFKELISSLNTIRKNIKDKILLTSWTPPINDYDTILKTIAEGAEYIDKIDQVIKEVYVGKETNTLSFCREALEKLGLPLFLATPVVERAFRSHI